MDIIERLMEAYEEAREEAEKENPNDEYIEESTFEKLKEIL